MDTVGQARRPKPSSIITLRSLHTRALIGPDAWSRSSRSQPLTLSFELDLDFGPAATNDDVTRTFSYGTIASSALQGVQDQSFQSLDDLTAAIIDRTAREWPGDRLRIVIAAPKALTRVDVGVGGRVGPGGEGGGGLTKEVTLHRPTSPSPDLAPSDAGTPWTISQQTYTIAPLSLACIIGVNPPERVQKQTITLRLRLFFQQAPHHQSATAATYAQQTHLHLAPDIWPELVGHVCDFVEQSGFYTVEALADRVATLLLSYTKGSNPLSSVLESVGVGIEKPAAITWAEGAGVYLEKKSASESR